MKHVGMLTLRSETPTNSQANRRIALEAADADVDDEGKMSQICGLKLAVLDSKTQILTGIYMCLTGAQGFGYYFPTLTRSLGYSQFISLLLVAPPHVFITLWSYVHGIISDRYTTRFWFCFYPIPIAITGFVVFMTTSDFAPKYISFFLMMFLIVMNGTIYSWIAGILSRPLQNKLQPLRSLTHLATRSVSGRRIRIWIHKALTSTSALGSVLD